MSKYVGAVMGLENPLVSYTERSQALNFPVWKTTEVESGRHIKAVHSFPGSYQLLLEATCVANGGFD